VPAILSELSGPGVTNGKHMPRSVTGIELLAFAALVVATLAVVGTLFAVFLAGEEPPDRPAGVGAEEPAPPATR